MRAFIVTMVFAVSYFWAWRGVMRSVRLCKGYSVAGHIAGAFLGLIPAIFGSIGLAVILEDPTQWVRSWVVAALIFVVFWLFWFAFREFSSPVVANSVPGSATPAKSMPTQEFPATDALQRASDKESLVQGVRDELAGLHEFSSQKNINSGVKLKPTIKNAVPVAAAKLPDVGSSAPSLPGVFEFEYSDADGVITTREVLVQSTGRSGGRRSYLQGICMKKQAERTFRLDRVIGQLTEVATGQKVSAQALFKSAGTPSKIDVNPANFRSHQPAAAPGASWETAVFFAGFGAVKKTELEMLADEAGWQVRTTITKTVDYVVFGSMVGRAQIAKAEQLGIAVIDEDHFRSLA